MNDLNENDLEAVTAGASKVNGLFAKVGNTLDSISRAAKDGSDLFRKAGSLFNS